MALAEAAENPLILSLLDSIVGLLREQRMRIFFEDGGPQRGQYQRILAAIERRDAKPRGARRCATICSKSGKIPARISSAARFPIRISDDGEGENGQDQVLSD